MLDHSSGLHNLRSSWCDQLSLELKQRESNNACNGIDANMVLHISLYPPLLCLVICYIAGWLCDTVMVQTACMGMRAGQSFAAMQIIGASEAKPLSSGWCETGRLGTYVAEVVAPRGPLHIWLVGWLVLWTAHILHMTVGLRICRRLNAQDHLSERVWFGVAS